MTPGELHILLPPPSVRASFPPLVVSSVLAGPPPWSITAAQQDFCMLHALLCVFLQPSGGKVCFHHGAVQQECCTGVFLEDEHCLMQFNRALLKVE